MKNARLFDKTNCSHSLTNLFYRSDDSAVSILDVVEDSRTAEELVNGLNNLSLLNKFKIDRITGEYVRLKSNDCFGNVLYFQAEFNNLEVKNND